MSNEKTALITGASSGIGEAFARRLARDGYDLIVTGRRKERLSALAGELSRTGTKIEAVVAELSEPADLERLVEKVKRAAQLEMLVNNAGFGVAGYFHEQPIDRQLRMAWVHCLAPMKLIHAALPAMLKRKKGAIINVSSVRALVPGKKSAIYSATKAFLTRFSESLAVDLIGTGVKVQALCPGFTRTEFHSRIGIQTNASDKGFTRWMSAEQVVDISLRDLAAGRIVCVPGFFNKLLVRFVPLVPLALYAKFAPGMGGKD